MSYLSKIKKVIIDEEIKDSIVVKRVKEALFDAEFLFLDSNVDVKKLQTETDSFETFVLYLKKYKGRFLKRCPGTKNYNCCGYLILHTGEGCPIGCVYCILQAYFKDRLLKVWANQEDLFDELSVLFKNKKRFRIGTGEFIDSLALEPITHYHKDILEFLKDFPNVCLEIKTKTNDLSWISSVYRTDRVLPAWSLNTKDVQKRFEGLSASIEERLKAASLCQESGFRICLHFDPILMFSGWEKGYGEVIEMIADYIDPERIAYVSLGSFRGMPELFKIIEKNHPDADFIYQEFVIGLDGKMRLLRPLRIKQFRFLLEHLCKIGIKKHKVYFCMESDEVWNAVFGYTPKDLGGLSKHLLNIAFGEIN